MIDLEAIKRKWLQQCGSHDTDLPRPCTCPTKDHRPVILELVQEIERLYGRPPSPDIPRWAQLQYHTTQRMAVVAQDREDARHLRCAHEDSAGSRCTLDAEPAHVHRWRRDDLPRGAG